MNTPFKWERASKSAWGNSCVLTKSRESLWDSVLTQGVPIWIKVEDWGHHNSSSVKTNSSSSRGEAWKQSYYQHPASLKSLPNSQRIRSMRTKNNNSTVLKEGEKAAPSAVHTQEMGFSLLSQSWHEAGRARKSPKAAARYLFIIFFTFASSIMKAAVGTPVPERSKPARDGMCW